MDIERYIKELKLALDNLPQVTILEIIGVLCKARKEGKRIYVFGNGGSATTASHITGDLSKNTQRADLPPIKSIALNESPYLITAYANDNKYENVFYSQLQGLIGQGDVVIAVTGSGDSTNVIMALTYAKKCQAISIALTGFDGGLVKEVADICFIVPSDIMEQIEDIHLIIGHIITMRLKEGEWK